LEFKVPIVRWEYSGKDDKTHDFQHKKKKE